MEYFFFVVQCLLKRFIIAQFIQQFYYKLNFLKKLSKYLQNQDRSLIHYHLLCHMKWSSVDKKKKDVASVKLHKFDQFDNRSNNRIFIYVM